jgi:hypothetical protein
LELIKDFDLGINYHLGKANVVDDALSRRSHTNPLVVKSIMSELCDKFAKLKIVANTEVVEMEVGSSLLQEIRRGQVEDEKIQEIKRNIKEEMSPGFSGMKRNIQEIKECCGTKEVSVCLTSRS